jgi:CO/xanthine dehydrogenase FAD-binding subunit
MASYPRPTSLTHPPAAWQANPRTVPAGGTGHFPAHAVHEPDENILDLSALSELRRITRTGNAWRISALTTWTGLIAAGPPLLFDGLRDAARQVGTSARSRPPMSRGRWTPGAGRRMLCAAAP